MSLISNNSKCLGDYRYVSAKLSDFSRSQNLSIKACFETTILRKFLAKVKHHSP